MRANEEMPAVNGGMPEVGGRVARPSAYIVLAHEAIRASAQGADREAFLHICRGMRLAEAEVVAHHRQQRLAQRITESRVIAESDFGRAPFATRRLYRTHAQVRLQRPAPCREGRGAAARKGEADHPRARSFRHMGEPPRHGTAIHEAVLRSRRRSTALLSQAFHVARGPVPRSRQAAIHSAVNCEWFGEPCTSSQTSKWMCRRFACRKVHSAGGMISSRALAR